MSNKRLWQSAVNFTRTKKSCFPEEEGSQRKDTWGINIYPNKPESEWIEFDSMVNLKPNLGNRSRDVENPETRKNILNIVKN